MTALLLALLSLAPGDVTVCRFTEIDSERPIAAIVAEGAWGYVAGKRQLGVGAETTGQTAEAIATAIFSDGWRPVLKRAWHVLGMALWDRAGTVEYAYRFDAGGIHVDRWARISNGHVETTVTLTGDLGEKRLRSVTLELEVNETDRLVRLDGNGVEATDDAKTEIRIDLYATINAPAGRLATRIVDRIAGPRLCARLRDLEAAGRSAVLSGESAVNAMIFKFVQRQQSKGGR